MEILVNTTFFPNLNNAFMSTDVQIPVQDHDINGLIIGTSSEITGL